MTGLVEAMLVMLGGAAGASLRYLTDRALAVRLGAMFPWGTLLVNVAASLILGVVTGAMTALPGWVFPVAATGFTGGLSTYSTFGYETIRLFLDGPVRRHAGFNVAANLVGCVAAAGVGLWLGSLAVR